MVTFQIECRRLLYNEINLTIMSDSQLSSFCNALESDLSLGHLVRSIQAKPYQRINDRTQTILQESLTAPGGLFVNLTKVKGLNWTDDFQTLPQQTFHRPKLDTLELYLSHSQAGQSPLFEKWFDLAQLRHVSLIIDSPHLRSTLDALPRSIVHLRIVFFALQTETSTFDVLQEFGMLETLDLDGLLCLLPPLPPSFFAAFPKLKTFGFGPPLDISSLASSTVQTLLVGTTLSLSSPSELGSMVSSERTQIATQLATLVEHWHAWAGLRMARLRTYCASVSFGTQEGREASVADGLGVWALASRLVGMGVRVVDEDGFEWTKNF